MLKKIVSIEYIGVNHITEFDVSGDSVSVSADSDFINVPAQKNKVTVKVSSKTSAAGTLYTIAVSGTIRLRPESLQSAGIMGCLMRVTTADKKRYILGSKEFPMTGTVVRLIPSTAKEVSGHTINFTSNQLHDALLES